MGKRAFDVTVSVIALVLLLPLFAVIGLLIKRDSAGPVLHREDRVGKNAKGFRIYKFRTTVVGADRNDVVTLGEALGISRFGRRLRRSKLDQLPALINVVRGEMSLVGPRPETPAVVETYSPLHLRLLAIKPGMTSPASLAYRRQELNGSSPSTYAEVKLADRLNLDLRFFYRRTFWKDLRVIGETVSIAFGTDSVAFHWIIRSLRRHVSWLLLDAPVIIVAFYCALFLRLLDFRPAEVSVYLGSLIRYILPLVLLFAGMNSLFGVHRRVWRFATAADVRPILGASFVATAIALGTDIYGGAFGPRSIPLGVIALGGFFSACGMVLVRYHSHLFLGLSPKNRNGQPGRRAIIYGAGDAGQHLALRLLTHDAAEEYELVGFADDDPRKRGQRIHGLAVLGGRQELANIVDRHRVDLVIIAMNNVRGPDLRQILASAQKTSAQIRIVPNVFEVVRDGTATPLLRELRIEDLLGRQSVHLMRDACEGVLRGKIVLITGGCGSVGSELCRQIAQFEPKRLIVLDNNETGLYDLELALRATAPQLDVSVVVGDVTDSARMDTVFRSVVPQVIFHAAAYKHVPLMERFPQEAVRVNVGGTAVVLEMARRYRARYFVLVSTDKAVEPHSVMGATKRIAEMLVVGNHNSLGATGHSTLCTAVRFGNVLGSRGSVVPTFAMQIDRGGPVTITHPEMTRYFMDVSEAAGLIIQAASFTRGDDIFELDMGERIRVDDLARKMIRMRGLRPEIDIPIVYTGVRPGEKLHEELAFAEEGREPTEHPLVHRLKMPTAGGLNGELRLNVEHLVKLSANGNEHGLVAAVMGLARHSGNGFAQIAVKEGTLSQSELL